MFIQRLYYLLLLITFLVPEYGIAQKEYNNWYFGDSAGINFNTEPPLQLVNSALFSGEASAVISDSSGQLLFYTEGSRVFNKNHQVMPNGSGLKGHYHATQGVLILQKPLCKRFYYIFTVAPNLSTNGANYHIVDMQANNGEGDVVLKNQLLFTPVTEKVTAIRHENGVDIWIIMHAWESDSFFAYLLTKDGLSPSPVISNCGTVNQGLLYGGYLKPNPKGTTLASAYYMIGHFELFSFNNISGQVFNPIKIGNTNTLIPPYLFYGMEFSPNGQFLYAKTDFDSLMYQYDLSIFDSVSITNSKVPIGNVLNSNSSANPFKVGSLQLAPNGKIYVAKDYSEYISCIQKPNQLGYQSDFNDSAFYLNGHECYSGLPNNPFTAPYIQQDGCFTGTYSFHLTDTTPYQRWDFGDPLQAGDTALQANPSYTYTQPGVYTVTAIYLTDWQTYDTAITTVYAHPVPDLLGSDTLLACNQDSLLIRADSAYDRYQWSTGADTSFAWVYQSGKYYVTATEACGCAVQDSVIVLIRPKPELGPDTLLCPEESLVLHSDLISSSYTWSNGSTASSIQVNQPGLYWLELSDGNCIRSDSINVGAIEISLDIGKDTLLCEGEELEITASGDFETIIWENGSTSLSRIVNQSGWVSAIVAKAQCNTTDSLYVRPCSHIRFPNVFTPNGDQKNDFFAPEFKEIILYKLLIFNRWGQEIYRSNDPQSGWDGRFNAQECQAGTYYYSATFQFTDHNGTKEITQTGNLMLLR